MRTRIQVKNLHPTWSAADVRSMFNRFGRILEVSMGDCMAYVDFGSEEPAVDAIKRVDGTFVSGRKLQVHFPEGAVIPGTI